jgi:hypothetical protein
LFVVSLNTRLTTRRRLLRDARSCPGPLLGTASGTAVRVLGCPRAALPALLLLESLGLISEGALPNSQTGFALRRLCRPLAAEAALPGTSPILHPLLHHPLLPDSTQLVAQGELSGQGAVGSLLLAIAEPVSVSVLHRPGTVLQPILLHPLLPHRAKRIAWIGLLAAKAAPHSLRGASHAASASGKGPFCRQAQHNAQHEADAK